jgi:hypothetical protein
MDWVDTSPGDGFFWPFKNPGPALQARKATQSAKVFAPTAQPHKARGSRSKAVSAAADAAVTGFIPAAGDVNGARSQGRQDPGGRSTASSTARMVGHGQLVAALAQRLDDVRAERSQPSAFCKDSSRKT